ncbi:hypothetical protein PTB13_25480, partial [Bacillus sp. MHSD17]|nr:hypothetical protein [Bacillus sp. MHSD17]
PSDLKERHFTKEDDMYSLHQNIKQNEVGGQAVLGRQMYAATPWLTNDMATIRLTERSLKELPSDLKERHFTKEDDMYSLHQNIKQNVTFKQHDLLMQSFDTNYDLIICRNVMIYFTEEARVKLYEKFSRSLRKGGVLFVGSTEQILTPERFNLQRFDTFFYEVGGQAVLGRQMYAATPWL